MNKFIKKHELKLVYACLICIVIAFTMFCYGQFVLPEPLRGGIQFRLNEIKASQENFDRRIVNIEEIISKKKWWQISK